jgi:hypothetical protein
MMQDRLSARLRRLPVVLYILGFLAMTYAVALPLEGLSLIVPGLGPCPGPDSLESLGLIGRLLLGAIVTPFIETALFQMLPIRVLRGRFHLPWRWVLSLSAALFGAGHWYCLGYVFFAFSVGLVLAYCFAVQDIPGGRPFLVTAIVHALRNAIASFML